MAKKPSSILYGISHAIAKVASVTNDIDNLAHGRVDKVVEKQIRKAVHKQTNKLARVINRKINI